MRWLLSLLLASSTAYAGAAVGSLTDDARFQDGTTKMRKLDYEGALSTFESLLKDARPDDERVTLLLYSGSARALIGDDGGARVAFEAALRIDDHASIAFKTSPKVLALFDEVRAALPPRDPPTTHDTHDTHDVEPPHDPDPPTRDPTPLKPVEPLRPEHPMATTPTKHDEPAGPTLLDVVGVGAGVVAAGAGIAAGAFGFDVASKMQVANDRSTSQAEAQELVDRANTSLTFAGLLGAVAAVGVGTAIAALAWPDAPQHIGDGDGADAERSE